MDHQYPTVAKIPVLDTGKFEQWQFRIQQYLQHEHYALWEVIEFVDSYKVPTNTDPDDTTKKRDAKQSGRTVTYTTEDMQKKKNNKKKNDVKARTTLLLSLPDKHQLRFSKYKTARELWAAILKTFGEGTETLEQTFNRLQVIVSQLQFMDVEVEKDDLNPKFLTSLAPEWLMHIIVWRNMNDLDSMSLDDLYNHLKLNDLDSMSLDDLYNNLKVYEVEVQKKPNSNSQDMAFISSLKNSNNEDGNTVCVTTATIAFPTGSVNVAIISEETASAFITSQSNGSQIKFEDINQIDEDDMEEMDIKWNMALLSMRTDKFWKRTGKKISIQGSDVAGFDKSKVECFNCHKMGHFARECRAPRSQERGRRESYRQGSKAKEKSSKALMAIDGIGWDWSDMANEENHALVADGETPTEVALMANIENKRSEKVKEGVGYNVVPPPAADLYLSPKKDLSWTGLPEFVDDTVTDYSRPSPTVVSTSAEDQNKDTSTSEDVASPNPPKSFVKPSPTVASTSAEDQNKDTSTFEDIASINPPKPFVKTTRTYCVIYSNLTKPTVGNKMHKAFPLPGESSHWQYKFPLPVEGVLTAENGESTESILSKPAVKFVKAAERLTTDKVETAKKPAEKSEKLGRVPTEMELILEHTQQGISYEVSINTEGVEELKRNDMIKGVKKEALLIYLGRNRVNTYAIRNTKLLSGIEDSHHVTQ
nr:hypothetical protein [Tanacetum cinerariifolium]